MGLLKRLFGGAASEKAPPPPAAPPEPAYDLRAEVEKSRAAVRVIRRNRDPLAWAEAQQLLANALLQQAADQTGGTARSALEEAERVLHDALEAADRPGTHPGFIASMTYLQGLAAFRRADRLEGDAKGEALADAANRFTDAQAKITPESQRALWVELGFYRGAVFQSLALLKGDAAGAPWLDEAAATFRALAEQGAEDGSLNPIAAYNLHVVLLDRAKLAGAAAAGAYRAEARRWLVAAQESDTFRDSADVAARLAALDAEIGASG
jgi:hypothetical protein